MVRTLATRRETDMSLTLPGADIHGFYTDLNITLPTWAHHNAAVHCFANPDHHHTADQHPSTSVHLHTGAWNCHGCGARGGAYDAAITRGHTPRSAIDLMIQHGLIEPRARLVTASEVSQPRSRQEREMRCRVRAPLLADDRDVRRWSVRLAQRPALLQSLQRDRAWHYETIRALGLGWDRGRITIPVRGPRHELRGVLRYQLEHAGRAKMLAVRGTQLGLIPHPVTEPACHIVLVEGPPDMIAARSLNIPAIAVPGDQTWRDEWARLLAGRTITIVMDADAAGRAAATRIHDSLRRIAYSTIIDIAPDRRDGYDLTDRLLTEPGLDLGVVR
jgi:hypothetical protein